MSTVKNARTRAAAAAPDEFSHMAEGGPACVRQLAAAPSHMAEGGPPCVRRSAAAPSHMAEGGPARMRLPSRRSTATAGGVVDEAEGFQLQLSCNATGYLGVQRTRGGKYLAKLKSGGVWHALGTYETAVLAAVAVVRWQVEAEEAEAEEAEAEEEAAGEVGIVAAVTATVAVAAAAVPARAPTITDALAVAVPVAVTAAVPSLTTMMTQLRQQLDLESSAQLPQVENAAAGLGFTPDPSRNLGQRIRALWQALVL